MAYINVLLPGTVIHTYHIASFGISMATSLVLTFPRLIADVLAAELREAAGWIVLENCVHAPKPAVARRSIAGRLFVE